MAEPDRVRFLINADRLDEALSEAHRQLAAEPQNAELEMLAAWALSNQGHHPDATAAADRAVARAPENVWILTSHARVMRNADRTGPAIISAEHAVAIAPDNVTAWIELSFAFNQTRRGSSGRAINTKAEAAALRAVELAPDNVWALNALAANRRGLQAIAVYERALAIEPENLTLKRNYAVALRQMGRADDAALVLREELKSAPADDALRNQFVATRRQASRNEVAHILDQARYERHVVRQPTPWVTNTAIAIIAVIAILAVAIAFLVAHLH